MSGFHQEGPISRRGFMQTAAVASQIGPASAQEPKPPQLAPSGKPRRLSDNLYVLEDTCNVYLIRDGSHGVLIDFGSGAILRHLPELGVSKIDWILHTHHHRDQAQGDLLASAQNIPIAVPAHEIHLFADAENFWRNRRVFDLYDVKNNFFSLTQNVPVAAVLRDYETFRWNKREFFIQPTPGHTVGSITLVTEVDGRKVAFSGDLMHSPGKVQTLYDLQYYYGEHEGVDMSVYSLTELIKLKPALLCPSHGSEIQEPVAGMQELARKLHDWWHFWHVSPLTINQETREITPQVIAHPQATSAFYAIISKSGKAMFIDYGCGSWSFFQSFLNSATTQSSMRFVEHGVDTLRERYGLKSVDVAIPTHMHDDHLNGLPYLARRYGTKIWAYHNMVDILQNPRGHNLGCIYGEPIRVDRPLGHRETFRWEEFEFTAVHSPGHTNYQMALFGKIDGKKIAFTGDAFFNDSRKPQEIRHNLIYRNQVKRGDHLASIRNILEFEPDIIAPGHGPHFPVDRQMASAFAAKMNRQDSLMSDLIAGADPDIGLDPSWVHIYPYQAHAARGQSCKLELRVRNVRRTPVVIEASLVVPEGWRATPAQVKFTVAAGQTGSAPLSLTVPVAWRGLHPRVPIAADVRADGRYVGQIAEALVDVRI